MAMTITQASAVNVLLNWITGKPGVTGEVPSSAKALEAAQVLAGHAHQALYAGWHPDRLPAAWPGLRDG